MTDTRQLEHEIAARAQAHRDNLRRTIAEAKRQDTLKEWNNVNTQRCCP